MKAFYERCFITKANDGVISHDIIGYHRRERYADLDFALHYDGEKNIWSRYC
jgi:hypothetical protein